MTVRKQLAALLANEQVPLPPAVVTRLDDLAALLADRLNADKPAQGDFIKLGMDWSTLAVGQAYRIPADTWTGGGRDYFNDATKYMKTHPGVQFEFDSKPKQGLVTVKRLK